MSSAAPLFWSLVTWIVGLIAGLSLAIALGPYAPTWGAALAFVVSATMLCVGVLIEDDGEELAHMLRLGLGFSLGFLGLSVPQTSLAISELARQLPQPEALEAARALLGLLLPRWFLAWLSLPLGVVTLLIRRRRDVARRRAVSPD